MYFPSSLRKAKQFPSNPIFMLVVMVTLPTPLHSVRIIDYECRPSAPPGPRIDPENYYHDNYR